MKKWKIGIVGCGSIGSSKHAGTFAKYYGDRAELVAFCDIVPERAEKLSRQFGAPGGQSLHSVSRSGGGSPGGGGARLHAQRRSRGNFLCGL